MMLIKKNTSLVGSGLFALFSSMFLGMCMPLGGYTQTWNPAVGDQIHLRKMQMSPSYRARVEQTDQRLYRAMSDPSRDIDSTGVFEIPVVFHIMYLDKDSVPTPSTSNPTEEQIMQGLNWLNDAFRNQGPYAGGPFFTDAVNYAALQDVDAQIQFCLAQTDPDGNPTDGINRVSTPLSNLIYDADCPGPSNSDQDYCMRSLSQWDSEQYMNIWLVNSICSESGTDCDIHGYSYNSGMHGSLLDGPVIEANYWGRSASEQAVSILQVGRYLNLLTTFFSSGAGLGCENGDCLNSGDRICDTPPDADAGEVFCFDGGKINTCSTDADDPSALNPYTTDVEDIYENFMDGGNMECKNSFTPNQKARMRRVLLQERSSLLQSEGCKFKYTNASLQTVLSPGRVLCDDAFMAQIRIVNTGTNLIESLTLTQRLDQTSPLTTTWVGELAAGDSLDLPLKEETLVIPGTHTFIVEITQINDQTEDYDLGDNKKLKEFYFFTNEHVENTFPYCYTGEDGKLPSFWRIGNLDESLTFDMYQSDHCEENGQFMMRYNSSGAWHEDSGLHASANGTQELLITPRIDLSAVNQAKISFDAAYRASAPGRDLKLRIGVKSANHPELIYIYQKGRFDLETTPSPYNPEIVGWTPTQCDDWRTEEINLDAFVGQEIFIVFELDLESEFSQNFYLDNICIDGIVDCPVPTKIPTLPGEYVADQMCTDDQGWIHYWKTADALPITDENVLLLSVKSPENSGLILPPGEVKILLAEGYGNGGYDLSSLAPYVQNQMGWHVMGRCFWTSPVAQANDSVLVRFYYDNKDVQDLKSGISSMEEENMIFYTLEPGLNPDPRLGHEGVSTDQFKEYRAGAEVSQRQWVWESHGAFQSTTFAVAELSSGGGGTGGDGKGSGALYPPEIQGFAGQQQGEAIALSWETSIEWATTSFEVFRSIDGENFDAIDSVASQGYSLRSHAYTFSDESPEEGFYHYYLQLKHDNGLVVFSDTIKVYFDPARIVNVYPNPTPDFLRIALEVEDPTFVKFGIYDGQWRRLVQTDWMQLGSESHEIDIQSLTTGIYFYVVQYKGKDYRGKLVKQRQ